MGDRTLTFPQLEADKLEPYMTPATTGTPAAHVSVSDKPFVTLTFATSLDSALSLAPGTRTALSGPQSKAMTHYLRSRHDAICVGVGTAIADDPGLNCRLEGLGLSRQPRPVVIDPRLRWQFTRESKVLQLARAGQGLAPFIITLERSPPQAQQTLLEEHGGKFIFLGHDASEQPRFQWSDVLRAVAAEGLQSIMIEGGGQIINSLLEAGSNHLINSVIVTVAPTWLGQGGVVVSPPRRMDSNGMPIPAARLVDTAWLPLGEDVVLCGRLA
ncbi:2,5-diamino-6-(ribosylamino)-4(3H)-pyrimidinone 5'-phosphate reductase [Neopestalotiopsis sp. 37M]|nr:2,5-diamino-6-(ribosylamino)-4(3H)-pyrimidinone 5'-phosphate reductase [Neopestalotiopsis sp. 37M]